MKKADRLSEKFFSVFNCTVFLVSLISVLYVFVGIYLQVGFEGIKILMGTDFRSLYEEMSLFLQTGVLYKPDDNIFFNTPFMTFLGIPYTLIPFPEAKSIKLLLIITIYGVSIGIIRSPSYAPDPRNKNLLLGVICFTITFFVVQFYLLNVYTEVMFCLLLSLYFYKKNRPVLCAFFLSLAVAFKIFLLPLLIVPLLARRYGIFGYTVMFAMIFFIIALALFGTGFPGDMAHSIAKDYVRLKVELFHKYIPQVFLYAGLQDIPLKMYVKKIISFDAVGRYTLLITILYAISSLVLCLRIFIVSGRHAARDAYPEIFATVLILILVFVFRYDFGIFFLPIMPVVINMKKIGTPVLKAILLMGIVYLFLYDLLQYLGMSIPADLFYLVIPQVWIGFFLYASLFYYWFAVGGPSTQAGGPARD